VNSRYEYPTQAFIAGALTIKRNLFSYRRFPLEARFFHIEITDKSIRSTQ